MSPTVRVVWEFGFAVDHEERRRSPGVRTLGRLARRWLARNGYEVTESPVVRLLGRRTARRRCFRWTMFVRRVSR